MEQITARIPFLRPDERIIGQAYLTDDEEIVFTPHSGTIEVVLVAPESGISGPWAVRIRPPRAMIKKAAPRTHDGLSSRQVSASRKRP